MPIAATQPFSKAIQLFVRNQTVHCLNGNLTVISFQQCSPFQFAKSLLAVDLQLSEVSCSNAE